MSRTKGILLLAIIVAVTIPATYYAHGNGTLLSIIRLLGALGISYAVLAMRKGKDES